MSDTLMAIIGIFIAVILMFVLPLTIMANKNDEIAQTVVQVAVSDFVETVTNKGRITEFDYNKLVQKISTTGNAYDIQIEAQIIDDNSRRATSTADSSQTGEYKYYSVYTNAIMDKIRNDGFYELKKDDYVVVNVKNTNITLGTQFKNMFYKLVGKDTYTIGTSSSGIVVNSDSNMEKAEAITPNKPTIPEKEVIIKAKHIDNVVNLPEKTITSNGLKIKIDKYNETYPVNIIVDSVSYEVGRTIPSYVLYFDTEMNAYVIDIKLVKEILNITDSLWATTNIQVDYVQTT